MMPNQSNPHYRFALALNNNPVILLEKGCYEPALRTLNDSLSLMHRAFVPKEVAKRRSRDDRGVELFDKASKRYSRALKSSVMSKSVMVEIEPLDDNDIPDLRAAVNYGPSSVVVFPVRISGFSCCENNVVESQELTKQLGIILYNLAVAKFLLSNNITNNHKSPKKEYSKASVRKSLQMAQSSLSAAIKHDNKYCGDDDGFGPTAIADSSVLLVMALTLNVSSSIFQSESLTGGSVEAQRAVSCICSDVDEQEFLVTNLCRFPQCAPAA